MNGTAQPSDSLGRAAGKGMPPERTRTGAALNRRDFFDEVVRVARAGLPAELVRFRQRANTMLLKLDYGNERIHFEVWPDSWRNHVEVGLHFEDGPASTSAYLAYFDGRIIEIKHLLGQQVELERWTLSWGHLFETLPLQRLDQAFARAIGQRLAAQIALLQPMVEEAAIAAERRDQAAPRRGRWPSRQRA